jgi:hypothetical protein
VLSSALVNGVLWWDNTSNTGGTGTIFPFNEFSGDPAFNDAANGDYHIGPASAAVDHGTTTNTFHDVDGEPRFPPLIDIGADEYWAPGELKRIYLPLVKKP